MVSHNDTRESTGVTCEADSVPFNWWQEGEVAWMKINFSVWTQALLRNDSE